MSWISWICFGICFGIILSFFKRNADPISPARVFGFIWSLSIGLTELKFSAYQHTWALESWILLLIAVAAFLIGTFIAYVLNLNRVLVPISKMRHYLKQERIHESRLFWLICLCTGVYLSSYILNFLIKGWLPISAAENNMSRVDFNVTGLTFLIYLVPSIFFFVVLYFLKTDKSRCKKTFLIILSLVVFITFLLFVSRFQIIIVVVVCGTLLYYGTHYLRFRTFLVLISGASAFFYWISSIRFSHMVATFLYTHSKMKFSKAYAFFTEPYMYFVMNLENFARAVVQLDHFTFGYYTFDFVTAIFGLKYWIYNYFNMNRLPYLVSGYNTYSAFWLFYYDFGVIGLALFPLLLGFGAGLLYYHMRSKPSIKNVTAYGLMVFVILISFFVYPLSFLWFQFNLLVIYLFLKWTIVPQRKYT